MAKEPTKPPEGTAKPNPPRSPFSGKRLDGRPEEMPPPRVLTASPELLMGPPVRGSATPDPLVVTAKAACDEHPDCTKVTTERVDLPGTPMSRAMLEGGRTSDPGYEPPSRTCEEHPDCVPVTTTSEPSVGDYSLPDDPDHWLEGDGVEAGPFWDVPEDVLKGGRTIHEPYAIIKDMRALYTDFVSDVMDATKKLRSGALKWLVRAIALGLGSVVLSLLLIGALGVVGAVWLFKALDWAEYKYWLSTPGDPDTAGYVRRERPWM